MILVMFDIDGTLTKTNNIDTQCYVQAIRDILSIVEINTNWTTYKNVTDQGCLEEIVLAHRGRSIQIEESVDIKNHHVELLRKNAEANSEFFQPTLVQCPCLTSSKPLET